MADKSCASLCWIVFSSICFLVSALKSLEHKVNVSVGDNVPLQCEVPRGTKDLKLLWIRTDIEPHVHVFIYKDDRICDNYQDPSFKHRLSSMEVKDGNITVILHNVTVNDSGTYKGQVTTRGSGRSRRALTETTTTTIISLTVTERGETVSQKVDDVNVDGGNTVGISREHLGLIIAGLCVSVVVVVVVLLIMKSKRDMMKNSHPPPDKTLDSLLL